MVSPPPLPDPKTRVRLEGSQVGVSPSTVGIGDRVVVSPNQTVLSDPCRVTPLTSPDSPGRTPRSPHPPQSTGTLVVWVKDHGVE